MGKADQAFSRKAEVCDTAIGWRFINPVMKAHYGIDSRPETAENVAEEFGVSRADQDTFAFRSQERAAAAIANGRLAVEIAPVEIAGRKAAVAVVYTDEHPRATSAEALAKLKPIVKPGGTVTASPRAPACWARRWWACRRASWALARRRPPRSCWHALAFQFRPWM